ncbi:hypothetical protein SS1G_14141 [Sclerotinia sclerotiorum 1980 UF-70]|uniref:Uncharacterized protein n=1 Tax=Sclerotinia sclerotiorum (strain ATCC 18683 / 1980 / Ss-1) TaxID=665079 RepID=A7F960_SCLS1|nr:hypothetical protein SS1G_14141 [Sclerotinia sclerotiorum 1980 UF-70]EDO00271.1 hypothetical protein SS1G_14141 [Sclerotinia sclerotiorum 1980 UF-70]
MIAFAGGGWAVSEKGLFIRLRKKRSFIPSLAALKSSKTLCEELLKWDPNRRAASWLSKKIQRSVASLVDARVRAFAAPATAAVASASNTSAFISNEKEWYAI